mmetsp:Transcript_27792/g.54602  ORF Transcript_27792/g.54602 Transcript_27792/m.54602 type:complete len:574 (-) Transcript_27792:55-1776(-)
MGGASSYIAMLSICGFLSAAWMASKGSGLIGISSIVLEIVVGVVLGPGILGLMPSEYATCEYLRNTDCTTPADAVGIVQARKSVGRHLEPFVDHCAHCHNVKVLQAEDQGRRLSSASCYLSFEECLEKSCSTEVSEKCGSFPDFFTLIGHAGVALMIFESGMHFDFEKAKDVGPKACVVAVIGTLFPLILGMLIMMMFGYSIMPHGLSAGTALAPTSVGISLRLLGEANVLQESFGQAIITAAFVDDILSLVLFNVLFSLQGDFDAWKTVGAPIVGIAFMIGAMVAAVKVMPWLINDYIQGKFPAKKNPDAKGLERIRLTKDEVLFVMQIALLVIYSLITHLLGTHLWGCFIAGMAFACLKPDHHAAHVWVFQTKRVTKWMVRIFFSCTVAFSIPVGKLLSLSAFLKGSVMGIFACVGTKVVCAAPIMGQEKWVVGWAMVGRAEFAYLIAQMALTANMLDQEGFSIVIWALIYATVSAPFVFRKLLNKYIEKVGLEGKRPTEDTVLNSGEHGDMPMKQAEENNPERLKDLDGIAIGVTTEEDAARSPRIAPQARAQDQDKSPPLCCPFFKGLA